MQISTRDADYIVDVLKLYDKEAEVTALSESLTGFSCASGKACQHPLEMLNSVFCNPSILKVLHGSDADVLWLQRDMGL